MFDIGRVCVKIAGRDAGKKCVIIDVIDKNNVLIDGETRRRKCNIRHLEPLDNLIKVNKNAPSTEVVRLFKGLGIEIKQTKPKKVQARPKKARKKKEKPVKQGKQAKTIKQPARDKVKPKPVTKTSETGGAADKAGADSKKK